MFPPYRAPQLVDILKQRIGKYFELIFENDSPVELISRQVLCLVRGRHESLTLV